MLIAFMHNYDKLLAFLCKNSAKVILMEPFVFPYPQEYSLWLPYLCSMSQSIRALAEKYDIPYVLLHNDLNSLATSQGFSSVTTDGIHLTLQGHQILADKLLPIVSRFFS